MQIIRTISELQRFVSATQGIGKTIGLVPTMGALHQGHASLIRRSVSECDVTIVSVFVNPTQFNDITDLNNYPRTLNNDCALVQIEGGDVVFAPSVEEIYPEKDYRIFSYPPIDTVMEGEKRPGHFNGVCQIVSKLFDMVCPNRAYFGEKDFQQIAVVRAMMKDLGFTFQLVSCSIVREESGLALSSRNALLTPEEKNAAIQISKFLFESQKMYPISSVKEVHEYVINGLNSVEGLEVEYFNLVDAETLQSVQNWDDAPSIQGCITVYCGRIPVRLIDNVAYKKRIC